MTSSRSTLVKRLLTPNDAINVLFASISLILSTNVKEYFKQYSEKCFNTDSRLMFKILPNYAVLSLLGLNEMSSL